MKRKLQSERADPEGRVSVGKGERGVNIGEPTATEDPVAIRQMGVVLDTVHEGPTIRRKELSSGLRPLLDRLRVTVVHLEGEDAAMAARKGTNGEQDED